MASAVARAACIWVMAAAAVLTTFPVLGQGTAGSTLDGIYTDAQAERGSGLYQQHCARCHSHLEFSGRLFEIVWVNGTLGALFFRIANTMPLDQPGSLSMEQAAALVAFILRNNGYPPGQSALPPNLEHLSAIMIAPPAPEAP